MLAVILVSEYCIILSDSNRCARTRWRSWIEWFTMAAR